VYKCPKCGAEFLYAENLEAHERGCRGSQSIVVAGVHVDAEIDRMVEEKVAEWRARGYPEHLIRMARELAVDWTKEITERFALSPEAARKVLPYGIRTADHWIGVMAEAVRASRS